MDKEQLEKFREACRQELLDPTYYENTVDYVTKVRLPDIEQQFRENDAPDSRERITGRLADEHFELLSLRYTAGESLDKLRLDLEEVVAAYERYAKYLREHHAEPDWPAFLAWAARLWSIPDLVHMPGPPWQYDLTPPPKDGEEQS